MPELKGMGLKDAVHLCEEMGMMVNVQGKGRVAEQSVLPGQAIARGQLIHLTLN
jgi:cell division protein FtsI (penicillin-binding protein 3)